MELTYKSYIITEDCVEDLIDILQFGIRSSHPIHKECLERLNKLDKEQGGPDMQTKIESVRNEIVQNAEK